MKNAFYFVKKALSVLETLIKHFFKYIFLFVCYIKYSFTGLLKVFGGANRD